MRTKNSSINKASKRLGISWHTLKRWIKLGKVEVFLLPNGRVLIPEREVKKLERDIYE